MRSTSFISPKVVCGSLFFTLRGTLIPPPPSPCCRSYHSVSLYIICRAVYILRSTCCARVTLAWCLSTPNCCSDMLLSRGLVCRPPPMHH
ncbi:hypothetical protein F4803DRAFT_542443 [Xylaria telfairii]|nr:hypothetical protein F4803DRAFT_542443 [Xylaria telfairii]